MIIELQYIQGLLHTNEHNQESKKKIHSMRKTSANPQIEKRFYIENVQTMHTVQ